MSLVTPPAITAYLARLSAAPHPLLTRILEEGRAGGIPIVDPLTGALLHGLVAATAATRVLEIGTAIGYSTLWMAAALPPTGLLVTLERDAARAATARAHMAEAGVDDRVTVMIGDAERVLHKLAGPFDLVFQDGDKAAYGPMLDRLVALLRPGGVLVTDNVLWDGEVVPGYVDAPRRPAADTAAIAAYNERLGRDPRLSVSWLPVGDGVAVAVKRNSD
ncbi:MAG: O-methyltransferase [Vicinamibacterales bacterium]